MSHESNVILAGCLLLALSIAIISVPISYNLKRIADGLRKDWAVKALFFVFHHYTKYKFCLIEKRTKHQTRYI